METSGPSVRVIVQARTDSSRLPAKALLPIGGMPSTVLAVMRAGNRGHSVLLATSDRKTDDLLADTAKKAGLNVFRGSAGDVLSRFIAATADLGNEDIVVRLTADNILPDGALIEDLLVDFNAIEQPYLSAQQAWGVCPYGLSAEVMRVGALRLAGERADSAFDREHVTPLLKKSVSVESKQNRFSRAEQAIRCTVDTLDDYLRISRILNEFQDPIHIGWAEVLESLVQSSDAPPPIAPGSRLVLGTAQLAATYGTAFQVNPPEKGEALELVRGAIHQGAIAIDTARAYSGSEALLGGALSQGWASRIKVVTKLSPLADLAEDAEPHLAADAAEMSVLMSLQALGNIKPCMLLHRADHLRAWGGAVWRRLQELKSAGLVTTLGVSVQSPTELKTALSISDVQMIQMPFNLLDWRWQQACVEKLFVARPDVEVHVRSVFLQGVLLRGVEEWPVIPDFEAVAVRKILDKLVGKLHRENIADLCLAYVRAFAWISGIIIGMERRSQLAQNSALFSKPPLSLKDVEVVQNSLPSVPVRLLNPAHWSKVSDSQLVSKP